MSKILGLNSFFGLLLLYDMLWRLIRVSFSRTVQRLNPSILKSSIRVCFGVTIVGSLIGNSLINAQCQPKAVNPPMIRKKLKNELTRNLRPVSSFKTFPVVYGCEGSGKTTILRSIIDDLENEAVFYDIPKNTKQFEYDLCSFLGDSKDSLESCILHVAASRFEVNQRPMILVLDSIENLTATSPNDAKRLMRVAKDLVDSGTAKIVFVCNDSAVNVLQSDALWSFADPIEVSELSELEAMHYLESRGVETAVAKEAVLNLTGGNLKLLERFLESYTYKHLNLETMQRSWFNELSAKIEKDTQMDNYQLGLRLLTDKKSMSVREALDYFSKGDLKRLVEEQILSYHSGAKFLKFRNKLVEQYFNNKYGKT